VEFARCLTECWVLLYHRCVVFTMTKAAGESFVSALYNKYKNSTAEEEQLGIKIFVPKSAPGYTSQWNH